MTPATLTMVTPTEGHVRKGKRVIGIVRSAGPGWLLSGQPEAPFFSTLYDSAEAAARSCARMWGTELLLGAVEIVEMPTPEGVKGVEPGYLYAPDDDTELADG